MTIEQKIQKATEKEFNLNGYEIMNIIRVANRRNKIKTATIESWFTAGCDKKTGFQRVECNMIDNMTQEPLDKLIIECCMYDRRMSFIVKTIDEISLETKKPAGATKPQQEEKTASSPSQFIFEGRNKEQRTGHEKIAIQNMRNAIRWIVGGYYNDLQDGNEEYLPESRAALEDEIYSSAMTNLYRVGYEGTGKAPKEMRFAGEKFCRAYIAWKLSSDADVQEIAKAANW